MPQADVSVQPEQAPVTLPEALSNSKPIDEVAVATDAAEDTTKKEEILGEEDKKLEAETQAKRALFGSPERQAKPVVSAEPLATYEQSIIQMLDRWVPDEQTGMYFKAEAFPSSVDQWDGIPLVFANDHPDLDEFAKDQPTALDNVKGRIVGVCRRPRFVQEGHPHLRVALEITDKDCVQLWEEGKLSLSTAFWASVSDTDVIGDVVPNHVLLFEEDDVNQPKDKGTLIQKGPAMTAKPTPVKNADAPAEGGLIEALKALLERFGGSAPAPADEVEAANAAVKTPDPEGESIPLTPDPVEQAPVVKEDEFDPSKIKPNQNKVDTMTAETEAFTQKIAAVTAELANKNIAIKEKDANIATLTAALAQKETDFKIAADILAEKELAIANKAKELETVTAELAAFVQKEGEAKFQAFVKTLPAGMTNKEEDVKALRELWDNDPRALANKAVEMVQSVKVPVTKTEGKAVIADGAVANTQKRTMGKYNMVKHIWED